MRNSKTRAFQPRPTRTPARAKKLLHNCYNVDEKYLSVSLDDVAGEEGDRLRRWFDWYAKDAPYGKSEAKRCSGLLLTGKFGFGKTSGAIAVAREIVIHGASAWFQPELPMVRDFRDREVRLAAQNAWMLILDDVGASSHDEWGRRADELEEIIRARLNANLPTIITTNLTKDEISERLSSTKTILAGYYTIVAFKTKNWRREEAKECKFNG